MAIEEDINALPNEVLPGQTGHAPLHSVTNRGLKDLLLKITYVMGQLGAKAGFSDLTSAQAYLEGLINGKANSSHTHTIANVTNLQTTLDGKAASSHIHTIANITNLQTTLDSKAGLVGGVIPTSLLPRVNIGETYPVANASARLALDAQAGDVAIQNDNDTLWMLKKTPATTAGNWMDLTAIGASSGVISVNGQTGTVVLAASDVSAAPAGRTITAGTGLTGGGDLTTNRTLALNATTIASLAKADSAVQGSNLKLWTGNAAAYAAIGTKDSQTVYVVTA